MFWTVLILFVVTYFLLDWLLRLPRVGNHGNKHVFITGCDSGFGRELAIRLDKMGFPVFAGCLTQNGCESLSKICSNRLVTLTVNVAESASIKSAFATVERNLTGGKELWAVVNNAGMVGLTVASEMCVRQDFVDTCEVNLFGPIEVALTFMPLLRRSRGRLVNMVSVMGRCPAATSTYCVSKFGLEAFSDVLRREVARFGVKVTVIEPGFFRTTLINTDKLMASTEAAFDRSSTDVKAAYGESYVSDLKLVMSTMKDFCSPDIYKVIDAYVDALTSRFPRARYVVGWDAKLGFVPKTYLPEWLFDWLMTSQQQRRLMKIRQES